MYCMCDWGKPERAPRGHDVYCTCVRACVRTYVPAYVRVGEACLGASDVSVAGNECSLGSDGWLRTRFVPKKFLPLHVSYERKVCA